MLCTKISNNCWCNVMRPTVSHKQKQKRLQLNSMSALVLASRPINHQVSSQTCQHWSTVKVISLSQTCPSPYSSSVIPLLPHLSLPILFLHPSPKSSYEAWGALQAPQRNQLPNACWCKVHWAHGAALRALQTALNIFTNLRFYNGG